MVMFMRALFLGFLFFGVFSLGGLSNPPSVSGQSCDEDLEVFDTVYNQCFPKVVDFGGACGAGERAGSRWSAADRYTTVETFIVRNKCVHRESDLHIAGTGCSLTKVRKIGETFCEPIVELAQPGGGCSNNYEHKNHAQPDGWDDSDIWSDGYCQIKGGSSVWDLSLPDAPPPPAEPLPPSGEEVSLEREDCDSDLEVFDTAHEQCFPKVVHKAIYGCEAGGSRGGHGYAVGVEADRYIAIGAASLTGGAILNKCIHIESDLYITGNPDSCSSVPGFIQRNPEVSSATGYDCWPVVINYSRRCGEGHEAKEIFHYIKKKLERPPDNWEVSHTNKIWSDDGGYCQMKEDSKYNNHKYWLYPGDTEEVASWTPINTCVAQVIYNKDNPEECGGRTTTEIFNGGVDTSSTAESCEDVPATRTVGWILCAALGLADDVLEFVETRMRNLLAIDDTYYKNNVEFLNIWKSLRNLATVAIVATALFMIIATALNFGFFSNYTVRKYLPRLVIGIIFIQLSWVLATIFIQLVNEAGDGIEHIVGSVVNDPEGFKNWGLADISAKIISGSAVAQGTAGLLGTAGIIALVGGIGGLGAVFYLYTAATMLLTGFMFLLVRKFVIVVLLILSPLGIALWILPGSDNAWRTYSKTFFILVLMYPLLIAIVASGKLFSWVVASSTGELAMINFLLASGAYLAGYAAIPFIAKRFSGMLGQFTGMVNDKSKGLMDKGRNSIEKRRTARKEFKGAMALEKRLDRAGQEKGIRPKLARTRLRLDKGMRATGRRTATGAAKNVIAGENPSKQYERIRSDQVLAAEIEKGAAQQVETADYHLQQSPEIYGSPEELGKILNDTKADTATRQAAANRIATMKNSGAMRQFMDHLSANKDDTEGQKVFNRLNASGKLFEAYGQKAPDIVSGYLDKGTEAEKADVRLDALVGASADAKGTWENDSWNELARLLTNKARRAGNNHTIDGPETKAKMEALVEPLLANPGVVKIMKTDVLEHISKVGAGGTRVFSADGYQNPEGGNSWQMNTHNLDGSVWGGAVPDFIEGKYGAPQPRGARSTGNNSF